MKCKKLSDFDVPVLHPHTRVSDAQPIDAGGEEVGFSSANERDSPLFSNSSHDKKVETELRVCKRIVECYMEDVTSYRNDDELLIRAVHSVNAYKQFKSSTIVRVRRQIQNTEGRLLPTDPEVLRRRMARSESLRKHFGGVRE